MISYLSGIVIVTICGCSYYLYSFMKNQELNINNQYINERLVKHE